MGKKNGITVTHFDARSLSESELDLFLLYMSAKQKSTALYELHALFPEGWVLPLLSLIQGRTLKIPSAKMLNRYKEYIKIYSFVSKGGFTSTAYEKAAMRFRRKVENIQHTVEAVVDVLKSVEPDTLDYSKMTKAELVEELEWRDREYSRQDKSLKWWLTHLLKELEVPEGQSRPSELKRIIRHVREVLIEGRKVFKGKENYGRWRLRRDVLEDEKG